MKRALLIGIEYKGDPNNMLNGCIDDIINMRNMLIDAYEYDMNSIVMLRDDLNDSSKLPTAINIMKQLENIVAQSSSPDDEIWIHYSGHGSQIVDKRHLKSSGLTEVIVPLDFKSAGFITDFQLLTVIQKIKCTAILMFDCCHSGTMCDLPWAFEYTSPSTYIRTKVDNIVIENPHIYMFSGCKDEQTSADTYSALLKESVGAFTFILLECLRKCNHHMEIFHLYREVCITLGQYGFSQRPVFSSSSKDAQYVFSKPMNVNRKLENLSVFRQENIDN